MVEDEPAWDIYLFYRPGKEWKGSIPPPDEYMHQMTESEWFDPEHLHTGENLVLRLREVMSSLVDRP